MRYMQMRKRRCSRRLRINVARSAAVRHQGTKMVNVRVRACTSMARSLELRLTAERFYLKMEMGIE